MNCKLCGEPLEATDKRALYHGACRDELMRLARNRRRNGTVEPVSIAKLDTQKYRVVWTGSTTYVFRGEYFTRSEMMAMSDELDGAGVIVMREAMFYRITPGGLVMCPPPPDVPDNPGVKVIVRSAPDMFFGGDKARSGAGHPAGRSI